MAAPFYVHPVSSCNQQQDIILYQQDIILYQTGIHRERTTTDRMNCT